MLAQRPQYPTAEHLAGLSRVADLLRSGTAYGDHLGYATEREREAGRALPSGVRFDSHSQRLNVVALAPYAPDSADYIWSFTDDEVQAIRDRIADLDRKVIDEWLHADGIGFIVAPAAIDPSTPSSTSNPKEP